MQFIRYSCIPISGLDFSVKRPELKPVFCKILKMIDQVRVHGYPLETHTTTTSDGYVLTLHRIPNGLSVLPNSKRSAVFLMHGFLSSSDHFVVNGPSDSLGYILADAGYDVWLGNARGNTYSRKHLTLSTDSSEFWDFRTDDLSLKDLPASIDYVLEKTEQKKLLLIAYSMGSLSCLSMLSGKPEYNEKIEKCFFLAPLAVAFLDIAYNADVYEYFKQTLPKVFAPNQSVFPTPHNLREKLDQGLHTNPATSPISFIFLVQFKGDARIDQKKVDLYKSIYPAGSSTYVLFSFLQNIHTKRFDYYNYGEDTNLKIYGTISPPEFPLQKVTVPVALFSSVSDTFSTPKGLEFLRQRLPNIVGDYIVNEPNFEHQHFILSADAGQLVYPNLLKELHACKKSLL